MYNFGELLRKKEIELHRHEQTAVNAALPGIARFITEHKDTDIYTMLADGPQGLITLIKPTIDISDYNITPQRFGQLLNDALKSSGYLCHYICRDPPVFEVTRHVTPSAPPITIRSVPELAITTSPAPTTLSAPAPVITQKSSTQLGKPFHHGQKSAGCGCHVM